MANEFPITDLERAQAIQIEELQALLLHARLQIEYLHAKFQPTGTGNAIIARINSALSADW